MLKMTTVFIAGAALGILGYALADSPLNPFENWEKKTECEVYYANELNMTPTEFTALIEQLKQKPQPK